MHITHIQVNHVYRFVWRWTGRGRPPGARVGGPNTLNRERLDGADVLVTGKSDRRVTVEALDGTTMQVFPDELCDVASTPADRFAGWLDNVNGLAVPPIAGWGSPIRRKFERDRDVADSVVNEYEERGSIDPGEMYDGGYARGVAEYARYLTSGIAEDHLAKLLDL